MADASLMDSFNTYSSYEPASDALRMSRDNFVSLCKAIGIGPPGGVVGIHVLQALHQKHKSTTQGTIDFTQFSDALAEAKQLAGVVDADLLSHLTSRRSSALHKPGAEYHESKPGHSLKQLHPHPFSPRRSSSPSRYSTSQRVASCPLMPKLALAGPGAAVAAASIMSDQQLHASFHSTTAEASAAPSVSDQELQSGFHSTTAEASAAPSVSDQQLQSGFHSTTAEASAAPSVSDQQLHAGFHSSMMDYVFPIAILGPGPGAIVLSPPHAARSRSGGGTYHSTAQPGPMLTQHPASRRSDDHGGGSTYHSTAQPGPMLTQHPASRRSDDHGGGSTYHSTAQPGPMLTQHPASRRSGDQSGGVNLLGFTGPGGLLVFLSPTSRQGLQQ
eukprot:gene6131-2736_t